MEKDLFEQSDDVCPNCNSTDIKLESVTLRFGTHLMVDGTMDELGIKAVEHTDFPILRCNNCGNIALSKDSLMDIIPALADQEIQLISMPRSCAESHKWN